LVDLSTAIETRAGLEPQLAAQVAALDPQSTVLQQTALELSTAETTEQRLAAARAAQLHVSAMLLQRLPAAGHPKIPRDPVLGQLAAQLSKRGVRR
jgi:hypothetical protein